MNSVPATTSSPMAGCRVSGYWMPPAPCGHDDKRHGYMSTTDDDGNLHTYCEICDQIIPEAEWPGVSPACVIRLKRLLLAMVST